MHPLADTVCTTRRTLTSQTAHVPDEMRAWLVIRDTPWRAARERRELLSLLHNRALSLIQAPRSTAVWGGSEAR
jgi:hypothetical protein